MQNIAFVMQKRERQEALLKLISDSPISRQEELAARLTASGFSVTQASVSRDLDELGVTKMNGIYARRATEPVMDFGLRSLATAGDNLIVGKCDSGLASAITVKIDAAEIAEIVGTIAGDDTIFIAVQNSEEQRTAMKKIKSIFANGNK